MVVQRGPDCSYVGLSYKPLVSNEQGLERWAIIKENNFSNSPAYFDDKILILLVKYIPCHLPMNFEN